jgi:hypothetical protein
MANVFLPFRKAFISEVLNTLIVISDKPGIFNAPICLLTKTLKFININNCCFDKH